LVPSKCCNRTMYIVMTCETLEISKLGNVVKIK
jgi:hypothetical protein